MSGATEARSPDHFGLAHGIDSAGSDHELAGCGTSLQRLCAGCKSRGRSPGCAPA
ncbi:hypothetical protein [Streptomyces sp. NPDC017940]|uniref:hypothetical protein n=1 Tax=Streptomyces sp. NPDC017940 TaxID=3365017 RepID=UPI0037A3FD76